MNISYTLEKTYNFLYAHNYYYIFSMTIYHILIVLFSYYLSMNIPAKTFLIYEFNPSDIGILHYELELTYRSLFLSGVILLLDFSLLYIIKSEIEYYQELNHKKYWFALSTTKIFILEAIILSITLTSPVGRQLMYFASLNTIQIFITYKFIKYIEIYNIPIGKLIFLTGSYINIAKLLIFVIMIKAKNYI